jgi:signal peptidase II
LQTETTQSTENQLATEVHSLQWAILLGVAGSVIALDQLTKSMIVRSLDYGETWVPIGFLQDIFDITYTRNTGAAFGMAQDFGGVFLFIAVVVVSAILYYYRQLPTGMWGMRVALGLQMGGALGNALDRVTRGYVVDFLHVHHFPIFNVADSSIVVGVGILIILMWWSERQLKATLEKEQ